MDTPFLPMLQLRWGEALMLQSEWWLSDDFRHQR